MVRADPLLEACDRLREGSLSGFVFTDDVDLSSFEGAEGFVWEAKR